MEIKSNAMRQDLNINLNEELIKERQRLDSEISYHESVIARYNSLQNLLRNKDFVDLILNGFIKDKSQEIFKQLILPKDRRLISEEDSKNTLEAISMLNKYIGYDGIPGDIYYESVRSKEIVEDLRDRRLEIQN